MPSATTTSLAVGTRADLPIAGLDGLDHPLNILAKARPGGTRVDDDPLRPNSDGSSRSTTDFTFISSATRSVWRQPRRGGCGDRQLRQGQAHTQLVRLAHA